MRWCSVIVAVCTLGITSCGLHGPPPGAPLGQPVPVSGTVRLADGTPLRGGVIVFTPVEVEIGTRIRYPGEALVDHQGRFKAGLGGSGNGLVPGEYKISVKGREIGELKDSNISKVPKPLRDPSATSVRVTVKDMTNSLDIVLH